MLTDRVADHFSLTTLENFNSGNRCRSERDHPFWVSSVPLSEVRSSSSCISENGILSRL
jgi:hypothetical protein